MVEYRRVTDSFLNALESIAGKSHVLTARDDMAAYSGDEACRAAGPLRSEPEVVVRPADASEVARVLALASDALVPVTPRGGGTGLSGGAVPARGGVVLSLDRMARIKEVDERNFVAVVEPGVLLKDLQQAVEARGLCYPLYPGEKTAHVGGNVATNAGGMRAMKYGATKAWVLGLELALPTGDLIRTGGKLVKCSTGYNITGLVAGSEGTLAVVTEATLRLTTPPLYEEAFLVPFSTLEQAIGAVPDLIKERVPLAGLEFLEKDALRLMEAHLGREMPMRQHEAFLLGIIEGGSQDDVLAAANRASEVCATHGSSDIYVAGSAKARRELLEARASLFHAVKRSGLIEIADVVVPPSRIAEFIGKVKEISRRHGLPVLAYGHAGDGNVHLHPMGQGMDEGEWEQRLPGVMEEMYRAGASLGGTVSGEHGLGSEKKKYLRLAVPPEQIELMKRIKTAFDPKGILNPGKVFD
ncbi:MAG: FAD-binding protein [Chloroflexi bacterium]|nr:FAD-binding protein [Chloroflexota bacterium]